MNNIYFIPSYLRCPECNKRNKMIKVTIFYKDIRPEFKNGNIRRIDNVDLLKYNEWEKEYTIWSGINHLTVKSNEITHLMIGEQR